MTIRILVVEDDEIMRITVFDHLRDQGWETDEAVDGSCALELVRENHYELILSDIRMPGMDGEALLDQVKRLSPRTEMVMMTAYGSTDDAVRCLKKGAADYILKPFDLDDLTFRIKRTLEMQAVKARCVSLEHSCGQRQPIIGSSPQMQAVLDLVSRVAITDASVLISGDSGTGKELIAAAIHYESRRADKPYIRINCAAIPAGLMESELFGHEKGAFTGADKTVLGKFELADQGTLLLDEIGDLPLELQVKLLRVLQEKEIERVGGRAPIPVNARILCATARDLAFEVKEGRFRSDLLYRLQVVPIKIPPLRHRAGDISPLADYFLEEFGRERGLPFELSKEARMALEQYDYPGNVRELRNILERASVLSPSSKIQLWDLPAETHGRRKAPSLPAERLTDAVADAEMRCIQNALDKTADNKTEAAVILGISRKNLWEKMKIYDL